MSRKTRLTLTLTLQDNVLLLLSLLSELEFYVRFNTVKLLTALLHNRAARLQECILNEPTAIYGLVDLLVDTREIIRNEVYRVN